MTVVISLHNEEAQEGHWLVSPTSLFSLAKRPAPPNKPLPPDPVHTSSQVSQAHQPSVRLSLIKTLSVDQ